MVITRPHFSLASLLPIYTYFVCNFDKLSSSEAPRDNVNLQTTRNMEHNKQLK